MRHFSRRRVIAAGVAGYLSINVAALLAAIEFGIQPMLFHDASGAPFYAPYPLKIAIPAMMAGHLTVAGLAELILSAGLVAWLQRSHPSLLNATAPGAAVTEDEAGGFGWLALRPLLAGFAALMLITPLGILAVGSAWGEWSPHDLRTPADAVPERCPRACRKGWSVCPPSGRPLFRPTRRPSCAALRSAISFPRRLDRV